jgi:hypothetical protein
MRDIAKDSPNLKSIGEVFSEAELRALCRRIINSGELGRSKFYSVMLQYLVQCSLENRLPRELELAIEVLGRGEDFDVTADSAVRVYVHQLRKKLDSYYENNEQGATYRIVIPKGQYAIAVNSQSSSLMPLRIKRPGPYLSFTNGLMFTVVFLLLANLIVLITGSATTSNQSTFEVAEHPVWDSVLSDNQPILLVMGDYYIFGELNANGNIARMVREFNINSRTDLEDLQFNDIEQAGNYLDLDLSYMPEGSAFALAKIVPILEKSGKPVGITMMSDLTTSDIRSNHIVYIGYLSALEKLANMAFAGSGLKIGRSYDELLNTETSKYYTSDAGLPEEGEPFRDYGMFSTFPASVDTQVILISGMRDAGLMHTAQALANVDALMDLVTAVDNDEALTSFEALFEVYGVDRLNFDANLVYARVLDSDQIWASPVLSGGN